MALDQTLCHDPSCGRNLFSTIITQQGKGLEPGAQGYARSLLAIRRVRRAPVKQLEDDLWTPEDDRLLAEHS